MPVPMPSRLAGGKTFNRFCQILVVTDRYGCLVAVGILGKDNQTVNMAVVGEADPTMILRARWTGPRPIRGEYVMSRLRPRCAYLIEDVRVTGQTEDHTRIELLVTRVDLPVPVDSVVHPWRWDPRGKNAGRKTSIDIRTVPALVPRHREVLRELVRLGDWARPLDVGATDGSHHHSTLTRLVNKGLAERRVRGGRGEEGVYRGPHGARVAYEYRATEPGKQYA